MTPEREDEIRGAADTLQWGRDRDAAEMMLELLAALDAERAAHAETRRERDRVDRECDRWQRLHNDRWGTDAATRLVNLGEHALVCEARAETAERERDEARRSIACTRYCLENDHGEAAVRACLDGMGMAPGIAEEYQSELDRMTLERDEARAAFRACAEAAGVVYEDGTPYDVATVCAQTRVGCAKECPSCVGLAEERDEARAALVALREAAERWNNATCDVLAGTYAAVGSGPDGQAAAAEALAACDAITDALAATPATLAGQVRARVLREARDICHRHRFIADAMHAIGALADEAAKEGIRLNPRS